MVNLEQLSYWEHEIYFSALDFVVIGAGIVGMSTAFHLRKKYPSANILVVERSYLPLGASTKNAGFACFGSLTELIADLKTQSEEEVFETVRMRWEGLKYLREILGDKAIDFQENGSWDLIQESESSSLEQLRSQEAFLNENTAKITGQKEVYTWESKEDLSFGLKGFAGGFKNRLEGQIDTGKMHYAWLQKMYENNIRVLNNLEILEIEHSAKEVCIHSSRGTFKTAKVVICVNGFAQQFLPEIDVIPARAQVLITKPIPNLALKGTFHLEEGFYYFRNIHNRILLGGGRNLDFQGEKTSEIAENPNIISALKTLLENQISPHQKLEIESNWSGIMGVGRSKKPIIKAVHPTIVIAVRLGGMGIAIGTHVGKKAAELC